MKWWLLSLLMVSASAFGNSAAQFAAYDLFIDTAEPLAAWQIEISSNSGAITVVGVENGASPAFPNAPYYDEDAVQQGAVPKLLLADFSIAQRQQLPVGRMRIATLHLLVKPPPSSLNLTLVTAVSDSGERIEANVSLLLRGSTDKEKNHE